MMLWATTTSFGGSTKAYDQGMTEDCRANAAYVSSQPKSHIDAKAKRLCSAAARCGINRRPLTICSDFTYTYIFVAAGPARPANASARDTYI
jgi:hypothetical protein